MVNRVASLMVLFLLFSSSTTSAQDLRADLDSFVSKTASDSGFSGTVLIARNSGIILRKPYGWLDPKKTIRIGNETRFYIASITKAFTAVAILKLEEQGKLTVRDRITKFFKDVPKDKEQIKIHDLLAHTSGLHQNYSADGIVDRQAMIKTVLSGPLKNPIGENFRYGNDGYSLLAAIIEVASGQTYENYVRKALLKPAGMSNTGFWGDGVTIASTKTEISLEIRMANWGLRGGVGMYSTVDDLYKWQRALFSGKLLNASSRAKLFAANSPTSKGSHGYGWFTSETFGFKVFWTAGYEGFGHNGILKVYGDGTVIIVLSNAGDILDRPARDVVADGLEGLIFGH